jgi:hypothetical protein
VKRRTVAPMALVLAVSLPTWADARATPGQTKRQAEVNVLRAVARAWKTRPLPGIINPRTHLLLDNTEAVCRGRGRPRGPKRYKRFTCVVRPYVHKRRQGLYLSYRTRPRGKFTIRWIVFRRR